MMDPEFEDPGPPHVDFPMVSAVRRVVCEGGPIHGEEFPVDGVRGEVFARKINPKFGKYETVHYRWTKRIEGDLMTVEYIQPPLTPDDLRVFSDWLKSGCPRDEYPGDEFCDRVGDLLASESNRCWAGDKNWGCHGAGKASEPHVCPFKEEIRGETDECTCCDECTQECVWEI